MTEKGFCKKGKCVIGKDFGVFGDFGGCFGKGKNFVWVYMQILSKQDIEEIRRIIKESVKKDRIKLIKS